MVTLVVAPLADGTPCVESVIALVVENVAPPELRDKVVEDIREERRTIDRKVGWENFAAAMCYAIVTRIAAAKPGAKVKTIANPFRYAFATALDYGHKGRVDRPGRDAMAKLKCRATARRAQLAGPGADDDVETVLADGRAVRSVLGDCADRGRAGAAPESLHGRRRVDSRTFRSSTRGARGGIAMNHRDDNAGWDRAAAAQWSLTPEPERDVWRELVCDRLRWAVGKPSVIEKMAIGWCYDPACVVGKPPAELLDGRKWTGRRRGRGTNGRPGPGPDRTGPIVGDRQTHHVRGKHMGSPGNGANHYDRRIEASAGRAAATGDGMRPVRNALDRCHRRQAGRDDYQSP